MKNQPRSIFALCAVLLAAAIDAAYHYPLLPERMASHFRPSGQADGWMNKGTFLVMTGSLLLFTAVSLGSIGMLLRALPQDAINLPNKEHWLSSERRENTFGILKNCFLWFAVATNALLAAITHLVYRANLSPSPNLSTFTWVYLGLYLAFTLCWTVSLTRRFRVA